MKRKKDPAFKILSDIHLKLQFVIWTLSLIFLIIRSVTSGIPKLNELMIVSLIAFELSLFLWFAHYSARYFLNERKARRHWFLASFILFVFLTTPFAFSLAISV